MKNFTPHVRRRLQRWVYLHWEDFSRWYHLTEEPSHILVYKHKFDSQDRGIIGTRVFVAGEALDSDTDREPWERMPEEVHQELVQLLKRVSDIDEYPENGPEGSWHGVCFPALSYHERAALFDDAG